MSCSQELIGVLLSGIASHALFNRYEPSVLLFLALIASGSSASLVWTLKDDISFNGLIKSTVLTARFGATFITGLASSLALYRLSPWHPLAVYPGPPLAKLSKWWMAYWVAKGQRHVKIRELHAKYGPWVRIGPNEISVNVPAAIRPIYSNMFRSPFYQGAPMDADALVTTNDRHEHSLRVVAWNKAFNADSQRQYRSLAQSRTSQLLSILSQASDGNQKVNLSLWISLWSMDIMGDMSFSGGFETMAAGKDSEGWMEILAQGTLAVGILGQVPWMRDIVALLPQPGPIITFQQFAKKKVLETRSSSKSGVPKDILGIIQNESTYPISEAEAAADASFMVVAGQDTISQALTGFFRYVTADTQILSRLREELDTTFDYAIEDMDPFILGKLPFLDACVQETLRMLPPVAAGPPRYSGKEEMRVLNKVIPPGTTVACPIYTLHHDKDNFYDPDRFIPERWLSNSNKVHNVEAFIPFSSGVGICVGKPVALHNMKLLASSIIHKFDLSFADGFDTSKFDSSYKEHNLWVHDPLFLSIRRRV